MCEVEDVTADFALLFGTGIFLIFMTFGAILILSSADSPLSGGLTSTSGASPPTRAD
jgi:hypothetical protein